MPMGAHASVRPKTSMSYSFHNIIHHLVLVFWSGFWFAGAQEINEGEALLKFKSSLANASHPSFSTWNTSTPPCTGVQPNWFGLSCTEDSRVLSLQLESMNLGGKIDVESLAILRILRAVSFMNNSFEGSMPDWKKIGALKSLFLSNNRFSGVIPTDAFKGMTSLKKLHLANNRFTGPLPNSLVSPKLFELRLENNQFTGTIPKISSENLSIPNFSHNQLEGPIPAALANFDPAAFADNKALCGKPLTIVCDPRVYPPEGGAGQPSRPSKSTALIASCVAVVLILILAVSFLTKRGSRQSRTPQLGRAVSSSVDEEANQVPARSQTAGVRGGKGNPTKKSEQQQSAGRLTFVQEDRHRFELQDLMRASAEVLGSGNFGASYKAVLVDGEALVVKRFKQMNHIGREDFHEHMRRLGRLKHPNLLPLVAYLYRKEEKLLVFDFIPNGSLATHLHGKHLATLSWGTRLKIIKGVAKGLLHLQKEVPTLVVPHGHLKSSNVLLDKEFNPLLMDYALAPVVNSSQVQQVLMAYRSPEYQQEGQVSKKSDIWCLGTLILETLTGKYLAQGSGAEVAAWVKGVSREAECGKVFDREMEMVCNEESKSQMEKLLRIGVGCCQEDTDKRWDLEETLRQIELIHHDDNDQLQLSIAN